MPHACKKASIELFKSNPFWIKLGHFVSLHLSLPFAFLQNVTSIRTRMLNYLEYSYTKHYKLLGFAFYSLFQLLTLSFTTKETASCSTELHNNASKKPSHSGCCNSSSISNDSGYEVLEHFGSTHGSNNISGTNNLFVFNGNLS